MRLANLAAGGKAVRDFSKFRKGFRFQPTLQRCRIDVADAANPSPRLVGRTLP